MSILPIEVWQIILELVPLPSQLSLMRTCQKLHIHLRIVDLYYIDTKYKLKLTDNILRQYTYVKHFASRLPLFTLF